jgi:bifunctional non-homologous end joining protein LigD
MSNSSRRDGRRTLDGVCTLGVGGIVSKVADSPYRPGRSNDWVKSKCAVTETFAVAGYGPDDRGKVEGILLGRAGGGIWSYAGPARRTWSRLEHPLRH